MRRARVLSLGISLILLLSSCGRDSRSEVEPGPAPALQEPSTATTSPASSTSSSAPVPSLGWKACGANECATLSVPLDHDQPAGKSISIAVARRKAKDPAARIGSLLFNPGGPGSSGIDSIDYVLGRLSAEVKRRFDVVAFDPRGVGRSTAISCLSDRELDEYFHTDPEPDDARERQQLIDASKRFVDGCAQKSGELLPHMSTADAARDMDLLRAAVGDEKLTYIGFSYGTELGAAYLNLFPTRVRALVLDGAVDPTLTTNETNQQQAIGFDSALEAFLADCRRKGSGCAWKPAGGPTKESFNQLMAQIDATPITGSGRRRVGPSEATLGAAAGLYDASSWSTLAAGLQEAAAGRGATLLQLFDSIVDRKRDGTYSNLQEVYAAVSCMDRPRPASIDDVAAAAAKADQESPAFGGAIVWSGVVCLLWPVPPEAFPEPTGQRPPVLVIGTTNDPATPFVWAQALAQQLGGRLLTYRGEGHTAYGKDGCVDRHADAYLLALTLPADGTTC